MGLPLKIDGIFICNVDESGGLGELLYDLRAVEWPPPREDPPEEPAEPWARDRDDELDWPWRR